MSIERLAYFRRQWKLEIFVHHTGEIRREPWVEDDEDMTRIERYGLVQSIAFPPPIVITVTAN